MARKICTEGQMLRMIATCVRRVHRLGSRCDDCLPQALERVQPEEQGCNWRAPTRPCGSPECELEVFEAIEELRQSYNLR